MKKILQGRVENRTKEVALAAMMLALFFLVRSFKIPLTPVLGVDFSGAVILTAPLIFSWPYTLVFPLASLYNSAHPLCIVGWLVGTQTVFFLSRTKRKKWIPHGPLLLGAVVAPLGTGVAMHATGVMNFYVYLTVIAIPVVLYLIATYVGGIVIWTVLRRLKVVE